ncbi:MAG: hypothetical protein AAFQ57_10880 [Cyanobacteria bacterium J06626_14]
MIRNTDLRSDAAQSNVSTTRFRLALSSICAGSATCSDWEGRVPIKRQGATPLLGCNLAT